MSSIKIVLLLLKVRNSKIIVFQTQKNNNRSGHAGSGRIPAIARGNPDNKYPPSEIG